MCKLCNTDECSLRWCANGEFLSKIEVFVSKHSTNLVNVYDDVMCVGCLFCAWVEARDLDDVAHSYDTCSVIATKSNQKRIEFWPAR